ncbi:hypothetical protein ACFQZO_23955 [Bradyrhizobium sp. GCM10027634]|uniref:hypothetical protein n=1 Tax=unclassified Bradyrhizobium TaxID=2631580 RepID=UPI001889F895|nr:MULTISPECIES: hypothetical protein [unclassified Bradyrhizobium]MDN5003895.1 hypothetical protein [Bradyrhizobium sp. WYCCWR 12677]QOZ45443.1 hypothetical protein XH89_19595 [Bradyrhizobium sp. CCBAU 53340]
MKKYNTSYKPDETNGSSRNLNYWSKRAEGNSAIAPHAKGGAQRLPDTGGCVKLHSTSAPPRRDKAVDGRVIDGARHSTRGFLRG